MVLGISLIVFAAGVLTYLDGRRADDCGVLRSYVVDAKRRRLQDMNDPDLIAALAERAREARAGGCDLSDLVGSNVGQ